MQSFLAMVCDIIFKMLLSAFLRNVLVVGKAEYYIRTPYISQCFISGREFIMQKNKVLLGYQLKMTVDEIINRCVRLNPTLSIPAVHVIRPEITLNAELLGELDTQKLITYLLFLCTLREHTDFFTTRCTSWFR